MISRLRSITLIMAMATLAGALPSRAFAATKTSRFYPGGAMLMEIDVGGLPATALIDTGASISGISNELAERLQLPEQGVRRMATPGGQGGVMSVSGTEVSLDQWRLHRPDLFLKMDLSLPGRIMGRKIDFILGADCLRQATLCIDNDQGVALITSDPPPDEMTVKCRSKGHLTTAKSGIFRMSVAAFSHPAAFDTGSTKGVGINPAKFTELLGTDALSLYADYSQTTTIVGTRSTNEGWLKAFALDQEFKVQTQAHEFNSHDGNADDDYCMGNAVLKSWNWILDSKNGTVHYGPSRHIGVPQLPDASGLGILRKDGITCIGRPPAKGSPAAEADLQVNDVIRTVNGSPADKLDIFEIRDLLRGKTGTAITIGIERNGKEKAVPLKLRQPLDHPRPKEG